MAGSYIGKYDTTAANNTATGTGSVSIAEGMLPSNVNNAMRDIMADIRQWYNSAEWIEYGDGAGTYTPAYASGTSFTIASADVTSAYHVGRRVKAVGSSTGTIYGSITATAFSTNTTVTVSWDSGSLSNESLTIYIGITSATNTSMPETPSITGDYTLDVSGDIILDADGGDVFFKDGGTTFGSATNTSGNLIIKSGTTTAATFSGANVTFAGTINGGGTLTTGGSVVIPDAGNIGSASDTDAIAISSGGVVSLSATTEASATGTAALTLAGGLGIAKDVWIGDDVVLDSDSAVLKFGDDQDTTLTHTDGTGLTLNSTNKLCFNDDSQFVQGSSATVLSLGATDEIDLTATAIDINGTADISGTLTLGTVAAAGSDTDKFLVLDGSGNVDYRTGTQVASDIGAVTSAPSLTGSTDNTVVTVTGANAIAGEANFTYDGTDAGLTSGTSTKPILSITNTNTDANGSIIKFIKDAGEAGAANDISGLISFFADDASQNNQEFGRITGRVVDATSGGEEGALDFYVAEYDGTVTKGMEIKGLASDGNITVDISTHDGSAGGLMLGGTLVTSTATELNLLDGKSAVGDMSDLTDDTSPQLGGDLDVNGQDIVSTSNADIDIIPNGTGDVNLGADTVQVGDNNANATITTQGTGDLTLNTNNGTNSGSIVIADGANGNIDITTNGTGAIKFNDLAYIPQQAITSSSNAVAWDAQAAPNAYHITTENTTLSAPSNAVEGAFICIEINFNGSHTFSWNSIFNFAADTAPTTTDTDAKTDILVFRYNGSIWQEVGRTLNIPES